LGGGRKRGVGLSESLPLELIVHLTYRLLCREESRMATKTLELSLYHRDRANPDYYSALGRKPDLVRRPGCLFDKLKSTNEHGRETQRVDKIHTASPLEQNSNP